MIVDKKERIIEAAAMSFSQFGFKATTMASVAKIAKVAKGTIYTFFDSKESLFSTILERTMKQLRQAADAAIQEEAAFHENIQAMLDAILGFRESHQLLIKLSQEAKELGTVEVLGILTQVERLILDYIKSVIVRERAKGAATNRDPELLAFLVYKTYIALIYDWERQHEPLPKETITEIIRTQIH
ncbi:DNA-binding transcriptional regulator, AcrR family [Terribacillus halophilus]|uniref:DNA-binding transcriptional regulator, AcrR family n=1 Tax=Terribacillus halophilus TaxID=361279 RepID=A0A1G6LUB7_9BACI|nr:TetR/AcrR family transcriptional regulator [Terribacillus halophilus]SDC46898.1 DNA-binding transcriptional regulator, AcrR family [Terribacillus halophilus]